jgi:hypothetical protein
LWECGRVVAEGGVVDLVEKDAEESGCLVVRIGLELGVDLDDERRGDGGEQTGLWPGQRVHTTLNLMRNSRRSESCSNPRRASS